MPCDYSKYPADWKAISRRIRERDGYKCKMCGVANGAIGARDITGRWHHETDIHHLNSSVGEQLFGDWPKIIKIVLTVAHHPDSDPMNCADDNLQALCQRCHNRLDMPQRQENAAKTRRRKKQEKARQQGQLELLEASSASI